MNASNRRAQLSKLNPIANQQGLALVSVLFITALVVAIITAISHRQTLDIQLTSNMLFRSQAFYYAMGAEEFASELLFQDFKEDGKGKLVDSTEDLWNVYGAVLPVDDKGGIEVELDDLQGRFNINSLIDPEGKVIKNRLEQLKRLFDTLSSEQNNSGLNINSQLAESLADWVDLDDQSTGLGSEDYDYLNYAPPYRTANYLMQATDELLMIQDLNHQVFNVIEPELSAIPLKDTKLNVNMASKEMLLSLDPALSSGDIDTLLEDIKENPFESASDFLEHPSIQPAKDNLSAGDFTVYSNFFLLKARITFADRAVQMYSVLWRDENTGKTKVIARDMSKRFEPTKPLMPLN
jgi:general secretion pathway protein K